MDLVQFLWTQITLKDVIDILIVAFLIYQGLLIIHGTRAVQMLLGLGLLMAFFWVAHFFKFYSLNWMLNHFVESLFIITIILFQDQFRNALANFGTGRAWRGFFKREKPSPIEIDEILEAVQSMSKERIGALIAIEREQGLGEFKATGTLLNAKIDSDLIYAIFASAGPLHDGAMIIAGKKMASAGCFFPLARDVRIERRLGTRHRAALGVSAQTDCLAISISEETGKIRLALGGVFYPCGGVQELRRYLIHLSSHEKLDEELATLQPGSS